MRTTLGWTAGRAGNASTDGSMELRAERYGEPADVDQLDTTTIRISASVGSAVEWRPARRGGREQPVHVLHIGDQPGAGCEVRHRSMAGARTMLGEVAANYLAAARRPLVLTHQEHVAVGFNAPGDETGVDVCYAYLFIGNGHVSVVHVDARSWDELDSRMRWHLAQSIDMRDRRQIEASFRLLRRHSRLADNLVRYIAWQDAYRFAQAARVADPHRWACDHSSEQRFVGPVDQLRQDIWAQPAAA